MNELSNLNMVSGVNEKGEGFITISATSTEGVLLVGQMSPMEARAHALAMLECAEAADQDAAVLRVFRKMDPDGDTAMQMAAMVITELREERER